MDMSDKDKFELEKRTRDALNYQSPNISSDWRFGGANLINTPINSVSISKGDLIGSYACSSAPMVDSFCPNPWDQIINPQNLGFCEINVHNNLSSSSTPGNGRGSSGNSRSGIDGTLDIGWNPPSSILKGGLFLPNGPGMLPQSLSQFPADSGFIERAARFSCFSGGNFSDMVNPFSIPETMSSYLRIGAAMEQPLTGNSLKSISAGQSQNSDVNMAEASKDACLSVEHEFTEGSPLKNERRGESIARSHDEAKQDVGVSGNESDEAEFSGGGQEEPSILDPSAKGLGSKKRKRSGQDNDLDQVKGSPQKSGEAVKDNTEIQQKSDQNPALTTNKNTGKPGKQGSASDPPKEEYIHVRARRGQATNSHSLAERVRREKISERMKFLQDLVPGCSKVTGKAVMLDEIINYVQSLQRQVEFLSMKLATVNPRLDFNIEGLLTKDILQSRACPSSTLGFSPDVSLTYPQLHQHASQPGLIQAGLPGMGNSSDVLRRTMNSQLAAVSGGYKEPTPQLPNVWADELHNVVQMTFGTSDPANSQDLSGSSPHGHMKVEL